MTTSKENLPATPKIFESPDKGKTVYSRSPGSLDRELEWMDPEATGALEKLKEQRYWREIMDAAETNFALQEAIDRVKLLYHLSKKDNGQE
jgi:hypothetical protein